MATGGSYMSMPLSNSLGVQLCMGSDYTNNGANSFGYSPPVPRTYQSKHTNENGGLIRSRPRSAPTYKPSYTRDSYYNTAASRGNHRTEFTTTEYRNIYSPAQPASQRPFSAAAPYQNRPVQAYKNAAIGRPTVDIGGGVPSIRLPGYDALGDPHLHEYFVRRFSNIPRQSRGRRGDQNLSPRGPGGRYRGGRGATTTTLLKETVYKVSITTGNQKNNGTSARVFLRMKGSKDKMTKKCLSKSKPKVKSKSPRENRKSQTKPFKFLPGTTQTFKIRTKDIGDIKSITLEHDGLTEKDAWFVDEVEIVNLANNRKWLFTCGQWFSLHHTDCQIARSLHPQLSAKTDYEITVITGDKKGAGTDANVFVTIHGQSGITEKISLKSKSKHAFEKNQSDIFTARAKCVGPMTKIRIEHDNSGTAAGWYLERVVISDLTHPKWKYFFPCGQWLAKDEGDGALCRDLIGSKDPLAMRKANSYKVTVFTDNKRGAGTDANVYVTLFGKDGDSAERKLDNSLNNFEKGAKDEFMLECACLGTIKRLRIGHDNKGGAAGWFLDKVIVDDMAQNRVYEFPCGRWLAVDEDDGQISRDLYCGVGKDDAAPGIPYTIQVETGDERQAGTSARIYVVMHGGKGGTQTSGKIWLNDGKFERARTDEFNVEVAQMLSPLSKIDVGHDNSGTGPGWYCRQVIVKCPSVGIEQTFPCDKWLALDEGEGLLEYTLTEQMSLRKQKEKKVTWYTWIHTSDVRGAGTDANVYLVVYGNKGKSDEVWLDNESNNFETGQTDNFKVEISDVGRPFKIRVGHDNSNPASAWHLEKVVMENMTTKDKYTYNCSRWLAKDEDDGAIVREIPAEGPGIKTPLPLVKYVAEVVTGSKRGAGTDANVFLNVFGLLGDTGDRPLSSSSTYTNKFENGHTDVFTFEAVTLKKLSKIRIGHDGKRPASGWFLDKVVVKQEGTDKFTQTFTCNRWLDTNEDDGLTVREITAGGSQLLSTTSYNVTVKTGDVKGAGTDANAYLKIFGEKGDTGVLQLKSSDNTFDKFERGRQDKFPLQATDIGKIKRIRLGHDGAGIGAGWFIDDLIIDIPSNGESYRFAMHRWLAEDEEDGKIEIELEPTDITEKDKCIPYEVTVWTGDARGAGTDSSVFIQMYGEDGKTEEYKLRNRTDNFEQGQVDKFKIEGKDIGPLQKIRVGHDGSGMFSGWHLDKILIQRYPSKKSKKRRTKKKPRPKTPELDRFSRSGKRRGTSSRGSPSDQYTDDDADSRRLSDFDSEDEIMTDRSRSRSGTPRGDKSKAKRPLQRRGSKLGRQDSRYDVNESSDKTKPRKKSLLRKYDQSDSQRSSRYDGDKFMSDDEPVGEMTPETATEDYWFICKRWFARNEDDGKLVRELIATDENGKPLDGGLQEVQYVVKVKTGDVWGAGTDANVFITMTGEKGDSGERQLQDSNNINKFERKLEDVFKVTAVDLGPLRKLKIWHDNKGGGGAWFLDCVEIEDTLAKNHYFFPCQRWLATDEDDGQIMRTLVPVDPSLKAKLSGKGIKAIRDEVALETKAALQTYHVYVITGSKTGSGTDANVYLVLFGENDDTGTIPLKATVDAKRDKFESGQTDEFVVETAEIGDLKKLRIGHDNAGIGGAWFLDRVEVDCPSLGKKWLFPCKRWLAKNKDDGALERELYPEDLDTVEYNPCIRYEVKVMTTNRSSADTNANVYIQLYGKEICTQKKFFCSSKSERKKHFNKGSTDTFVVELEDVGDTMEKIRIGHDGSGFGDGWHLSNVAIRKLHESGKGSITYSFPCDRWLARDEEDGALERELVAGKVTEEVMGKNGQMKKKEKRLKEQLLSKKYTVNVYTGDISGAGTDANVFLIMFGDKGDSGERKLHKSDTYKDKFERAHCDVFQMEIVDLGKIFKCKVRHDNSFINPSWYLDKIEVVDQLDKQTYVFHCERWLAKSKDDGRLERSLYVKGYDGDTSSAGTLKSFSTRFGGSTNSLDSAGKDSVATGVRLTKRQSMILEGSAVDGPTISYTAKLRTGDGEDNGTESHAWVNIIGTKKRHTGKLYLDLIGKTKFEPSSVETFSLEGVDVGEVKQLEIGHDGTEPGSGWLVKEIELDIPTKGKHYIFACKQWLAKDKSDGKTSRVLHVSDGQSSMTAYKPMVPYEVTFYTGDVNKAGTDANIKLTAFGDSGSCSEQMIDKKGDRFERAKADLIRMDIDDIAPIKKIRVEHDGKSSRPDWFLEKVELRNMDTGDLAKFECNLWLSKTMGDGRLRRDIAASVRGKVLVKTTSYKITVKTSEEKGAGTDANVYVCLFGENGDSGPLHLKDSKSNKSPFETRQEDVFVIPEILSLGELTKCRVWHDNKGFGAAWHCGWVEVLDEKRNKKYMFPCNRWLSKSDDDKQIVRELTCSTAPDTLKKGDKMSYEITIVTSDKKDGGMMHNAWLMLEGEKKKSREFNMKNSPVHKVFRKGNSDTFTMEGRYLGKLKRVILGATQREDKPLGGREGGQAKWHCYEVTVSEGGGGCKYIFPCKKWIKVAEEQDISEAVVLKCDDEKTEESKIVTTRSLAPVKYEIIVITGDVKGAGTNANVCLTLYGTTGDSGKRELTQKFRDLFERKQTDKFEFEALDLGELVKCKMEHDNAGWRPGWFLDRVEVTNLSTNKKYVFPCEQWLDEKKGDGLLYKELLPRD